MRRPGTSLLFIITVLSINGCERQPKRTLLEGLTMGIGWSIVISGEMPDRDSSALRNAVQARLDEIDRTMSTYIDESELSRINRSHQDGWIDISEDLYNVIAGAVEISHLSGGAFDITIGPVVNLWGFGPDDTNDSVPAAEKINATLEMTGYTKLKTGLSPPGIKKTVPELYLDLSGIAKGYAVDEIAALLESREISDYMVDIGGEIMVRGRNPDGRLWRLGVEKPVSGERSVQQIIPLHDTAMATSGDYRNYFEKDGIRYSHTIDPRTGYPVRHNLASVTVLHESAMTADALATALLVMGPTDGLNFAARNQLPAFFIIKTRDGFIEQQTKPFRHYLEQAGNG
ncbi:MAG: FAD:protein FMN transferase [Gammaproteobacteria bacterium]